MAKISEITVNDIIYKVEDKGAVRFDGTQNLTNDQQEQVRVNIGAASAGEVERLSEEIAEQHPTLTAEQIASCKEFASLFGLSTGKADSFLFFTDPHTTSAGVGDGDVSSDFLSMLNEIAAVYNNTPTSMCVCGGDWLNNGNTRDNASWILGKIDGEMKRRFKDYVLIVGNHDTNYQGYEWAQSGYNRSECEKCQLSTEAIRNLLHRKYSKSYFAVNSDSTTFFVFDTGLDWYADMDTYRWEQIDWFANFLLTTELEHGVVMMHITLQNENEPTPFVDAVTRVATAYNDKTTITLNNKTYDFKDVDGLIGFVISGHSHKDLALMVNNIAVITTTNVLTASNMITFDLVFVDWDSEKVSLVRIGDGLNRTISFRQKMYTSYTNLANPKDPDWANDKGINSANGELVENDVGGIVSNYIPVMPGVKIYAKGFNTGAGTANQFSFGLYKADKSYNTGTGKVYYVAMKNAGQLMHDPYDESIFIVDTTSLSNIDTVRYIRVAGIPTGSVDDIVITVDEPIV